MNQQDKDRLRDLACGNRAFVPKLDPAAILSLLEENERLSGELVREAGRTAEQKLRADHLSIQHSAQAAMHRMVSEQFADYRAAMQHKGD